MQVSFEKVSGEKEMNRSEFWEIITVARERSGRDCERQAAIVQEILASHLPDDIVDFSGILDELMSESYSWDLWGACYIMRG